MLKKSPRTWLSLLGTLIVLVTFTLGGGIPGLLLGSLVAVSWWVLPPMYTFVLGHFALLVVLPATGGLAVVAGAEVGLVTMLCTSTIGPPRPGRVLALATGAIGGATVLAWLSYHRLATVWGVGGVVIGGGAILAYWIHRYERVALDPSTDTMSSSNE